jgi:hypothetical protein
MSQWRGLASNQLTGVFKMNTIKQTLSAAVNSVSANDRLALAASLAANYNKERDNRLAASNAAAAFAAEVLGMTAPESSVGGQATAKGLALLTGKDPVKTCLVAILKKDREVKRSLFWGLDAARRSAAVEAYRAQHAAATAEEAASIAAGVLSEPYACSDESALYPDSGDTARLDFEEDSVIWEALALLLSDGQTVPRLARFWQEGFEPVICDEWEDVESFLAK